MAGLNINPSVEVVGPVHHRRIDDRDPYRSGGSEQNTRNPYKGMDALLVAYFLIFNSVQLGHDTALVQAKGLQSNALAQNQLIGLESDQEFSVLRQSQLYDIKHDMVFADAPPAGCIVQNTPGGGNIVFIPKPVSQADLDANNLTNQQITGNRGVLEDQISALRQDAQIKETALNSTSDGIQQGTQQDSSLTQMLTSLINQLARIQ